jgi:hypothetical protein
MEQSSPIGRTQLGFAALFVTPSPKKTDGKADQAVDDEPYIIDKRKLSTTTAAKGDLNNCPSPKKWMETPTKLLITNYSLTRGSHQA